MRRSRGFTLVETLAAVAILVILIATMWLGLASASDTYRISLFNAESATLADTVDTAIGDVLRYALWEGEDRFTNPDYGVSGGRLFLKDGKLCLTPSPLDRDADGLGIMPLLSDGAYSNLELSGFSLLYEDGVFRGSYTIAAGEISREIEFCFRTLRCGTEGA
ncbi:prepilin-type N-terminal cleavage/methylation domain-containing protein [Oscillibacter sp. MSJ-2]|uniref:Prepilin-type N-terminal cleavage/methylation domain-containing protein n=1 Tax=Dysosmobacter acutus TaxID=2841504 RepID=A0ABS6FBV6_9FIRM|nr:prepilin-type N-terminal cleavage/methylation domain-containing protein [Dysosmobacter acutus]MBU5627545.1 prepilin-type N-terminal cleavage/methylation domain-containing protein [Dysosmobacter acutus]